MKTKRILFWIATVTVLAVVILPILWVYLTAIKSSSDILTSEIFFVPTLSNYKFVFSNTTFLLDLRNTLIISIASTILVMFVSVPAAYSFARWNTGSGHLLFVTVSTRMFPGVVAAIPFFMAFRELGLLDTHIGLVLLFLYFNMSFATFLLYAFFTDIPVELERAAMVDGYGRMEVSWKVVFPMVRSGVVVTAIFCLVWAWNEFLFSFLFTRLAARTLTVGLSSYWATAEIMWGPLTAAMSMSILPTLLIAVFMQRYIIRGLTFGAVKG